MPGFLQRLMPRDGYFFILFQKHSGKHCCRRASLHEDAVHYGRSAGAGPDHQSIEHNSDKITHQIFRKLNHFAPFYGPPPPFGISLPLSLLEPPSPRP